jgi:hypothetical protein
VKTSHRAVAERLLEGLLIRGGRIERDELTQEEFWEVAEIGKTEGTRTKQRFMISGTLRDAVGASTCGLAWRSARAWATYSAPRWVPSRCVPR